MSTGALRIVGATAAEAEACESLLNSLHGYGTDWLPMATEEEDVARIFAFLQAERERCAKIAETHEKPDDAFGYSAAREVIAAKIRSGE